MTQAKITLDDVVRVARLARLSPTEEEAKALCHTLGEILTYVAVLDEVDVSGVEATAQAVVVESALREDLCAPSLSCEEALAQAPAAHDGGFAVPKVLEIGS
jgi:aspartyl-tRNA(Asn)/glutamyl-tRNA(Gln) amidotransferase subunit C